MNKKDSIFKKKFFELDWSFNKTITEVFDNMIRRSIPSYDTMLYIICLLSKIFIKSKTVIYDLGCSIGTLSYYICKNIKIEKGYKIIAVDKSKSMINFCRKKLFFYNKNNLVEIIEDDACNINIKNASIVILNFTLQFIEQKNKFFLLKKIYQGINPGGLLIISEKVSFSDIKINKLFINAHHNFKQLNGYSLIEIEQKKKILEHIIEIDNIEDHKKRLKKIGFTNIEICFQHFNFALIIAIKN